MLECLGQAASLKDMDKLSFGSRTLLQTDYSGGGDGGDRKLEKTRQDKAWQVMGGYRQEGMIGR